jgi:ADP-heptose:LPS heptosyltransferase
MKPPDFNSVQRVLVVKPSSLGDVVHTLPAVHRLKQTFPHLRIDWLVNPEWKPLLEGNPDLVDLVTFPRREFKGSGGWKRYRAWMKEFKWRPPPDVVLDFQGLLRSAWISRQSGARVIMGMSDSREGARFLHHIRVPVKPDIHSVDRYLTLVAACGATTGPVQFPLPIGNCPETIFKATLPRDFVLLHPFSRGTNKSMSGAQVKQFCELMAPIGVFVVGSAPVPEHLMQLPPSAFNLLNQTSLPELIWLMRKAKFTVSVDSGPMHIAAAISSNVLGIHTWSDPRLVGPYPPDAFIWKGGQILRHAQADAQLATLTRQIEDSDIEPMVDFVMARLAE